MKTRILQKSAVGVTLLCWLIFLWLHTFVRMAVFSVNKGEWGYLIPAVITLLATFLYTNAAICLKNIFLESNVIDDKEWGNSSLQNRSIEERNTDLLSKSLLGVLILTVLFLVALILEVWLSDFVFYTDRTYISIGEVEINKKYIYEPCLIIFCLFTQLIFEGMKIQKYRCISVISGCFQIIALSMMEFLLFMTLPNIWLMEMAFINMITIVTAVWKYVWDACEKKGNVVALVILYVMFWSGLLLLFGYPGQSIVQYIYGGDWREYAGNVQLLLENAKVFGAMPELQSNIQMQEFMSNRSNYLHNVLCYFGWGIALLLFLILAIFLISTRIMLGKNGKYHKNYLVYNAAWWMIALRVIIGIPYSMGLLPIPIGLPLSGDISLYMDTMAISVLIWCFFENREIDFVLSYTLMDKDEYIDEKHEIVVTRPKSEELYMGSFDTVDECLDDVDEDDISESEDVIYKSGNFEIPCSVQCLRYSERNFGVFDPINDERTRVFVLVFCEETKMWIAVRDEKLCERIIHKSLMRYIEDCMEEAE